MMRPDELSRPINHGRTNRLPEATLILAERYLEQMREAKSMREHKVYGPFKALRSGRLERKADEIRWKAASDWGELYLRFRPVISNAFAKAKVLHGPAYSGVDFFNRVAVALEEEIGRDLSNNCFADLLWKALEATAAPHASAIQDLRCKAHVRAVLDSCTDEAAVKTVVQLAYLRGELAKMTGQVVPALSDLEFDELEHACEAVGNCLRTWGDDLDHLTASVLSSQALKSAKPGEVVLAWIQ